MTLLEEKLLVNILYRPGSEILKGIDPDNINFEKLITLSSGHLMLPALFFNINKKNKLKKTSLNFVVFTIIIIVRNNALKSYKIYSNYHFSPDN